MARSAGSRGSFPGFGPGPARQREAVRANPQQWRGLVLEGHGLFSWGATARTCYDNSIDLIARAARALNAVTAAVLPVPPPGDAVLLSAIRHLRPLLSRQRPVVCERLGGGDVRAFTASPELMLEAARGTACPDHFLRIKPWPMILDAAPLSGPDAGAYVADALATYNARYTAYYERCRHDDSPALRDSDPVVVLVRGQPAAPRPLRR